MNKRSVYRADTIVGVSLLAAQYIFDIDFGAFVWAIALMTLGFAAGLIVTPADSQEPGE